MKKTIMLFECPKCQHGARAELEDEYKFLIYKCPNCSSNVVYYNNRLDIISDKMIDYLKKKRKLRFCRNMLSSRPAKKKTDEAKKGDPITADRIIDLKILLATESDFDKLMSQL